MHHPNNIATGSAVVTGQGIAPITWMLILIGVGILGIVIYYVVKLKKNDLS